MGIRTLISSWAPGRLARGVYRRAFPFRQDRAREWRGTPDDGRGVLRLARYGDCSWRSMDLSHDVGAPPGYPKVLAEELDRRGLSMEFSNWFVPTFEELPATREELVRGTNLTAPPDLVLLQVGAAYGVRKILPELPRFARIQQNMASGVRGPMVHFYRALGLILRVVGRRAFSYQGLDRLHRFAGLVHSTWPEARLVVLGPWLPRKNGFVVPSTVQRVADDLKRECGKMGLQFCDCRIPLGDAGRELYAGNEINLTGPGHEVLGRWLSEGLLERPRHAAGAHAALGKETRLRA